MRKCLAVYSSTFLFLGKTFILIQGTRNNPTILYPSKVRDKIIYITRLKNTLQ